jgi:hypothetical protein
MILLYFLCVLLVCEACPQIADLDAGQLFSCGDLVCRGWCHKIAVGYVEELNAETCLCSL